MAKVTGGDKLEGALAAIAKKLSSAKSVRVGFIGDATYPDGTPVAMVAAIQEWGAPKVGIPARPFFRSMIANKSPEWPKLVGAALVESGFDTKAALSAVGLVISGQLQESIYTLEDPPLSPVTVMLRGMNAQPRYRDLPFGEKIAEARARVAAGKTNYGASTKPLVDTGTLAQSVDFEVE